MAGPETPVGGRQRGWYIFGLVVSIAAAVFFALAMLGGIDGATGSASERARSGETFGGDLALAVVGAVICAICIALAVHFEHQLRRHQPAARAWTGTVPTNFKPLRLRSARGRYSPGATIFALVLFSGLFIGMVAGAVVTHGEADRSARVQNHGIPRLAMVLSVHNHYHSSRGGGYYTADITVTFAPPVQGQSTTVVRFPGRSDAVPGEAQAILIDPKNVAYAEFPGSPSTANWTWIILLVFAVLIGALDALLIYTTLKLWRHHRNMRTMARSDQVVGPVPD